MRTLIVLLIAGFMAFSAKAHDWSDADLGRSIHKGFATRDHIWLLGESRKVVRFDRATAERTVVAEEVRDLLANGDKLWVLIQAADSASFSLRDLRSDAVASSPDHADSHRRLYVHPSETSEGEVLGMFVWPGGTRPAILAQRAVIAPTAEGWKRWTIAASLSRAEWMATPDGRSVYVGYNWGEWGGGLRRIDVPSGSISFVAQTGEGLCEGAINPACSPVTGLFPDRRSQDCITVATGLAHLGSSHGDVYRVCGSEISPVFSTPTPTERDPWMLAPRAWPLHGLYETANGWIGISRDRYFRSRNNEVTEHPMPAFNEWAGLRISEEQDGVLFVMSACCWGSSTTRLHGTLALPVS